jgi:hypothetical protein
MKCTICGKRNGKRLCARYNKQNICSQCCGENRDFVMCNSLCDYYPKEKSDAKTASNVELTQVDNGKIILFAEDLFLPNIYDNLYCDILKYNILLNNPAEIIIELDFILKKRVSRDIDVKELYYIDEWKTENVDFLEVKAPLVQIYTLKNGHTILINDKYEIDGREESIIRRGNYLNTCLPFSKKNIAPINVIGMPEFQGVKYVKGNRIQGKHFLGKNDCFFGEFQIDKIYKFKFLTTYESLNYNNEMIEVPIGVFLPFPHINTHKYSISINETMQIDSQSNLDLLLPFEDDIDQLFLTPLEGNENSLSSPKYYSTPLLGYEEQFHYDRYCILMHNFLLQTSKELIMKIHYSELPIVSGVYESVNQLYNNKYAPIKLTILNSSKSIKSIEVTVEMLELSDREVKNFSIKPHEFICIPIAPHLKQEVVNSLKEITMKNLNVKIVDMNKNKILEESKLFKVYPKETFIFKLDNFGGDWKLNLTSYIARWITPHIEQIDEIIANAGKGKSIRGILSPNETAILSEMKAIYDIISQDITYISRTFSYDTDLYKLQRISLPSTTLKYKSGNCIDLSILLASCYEAIRIPVYIVLVPGHAFLKVCLLETQNTYIEATYLGKKEFYEASEYGREMFDKYFDEKGNAKVEGAQIVDIAMSRKAGIYPME